MTATCSTPVQDTARHWFVALARVVCFINIWWKVPVWHLLPKNRLFWRLLPCGACRVIPGSLLPAQEGGKLPAIAAGHKAIHRGVWLSQHVVICHLPLWCGLFHCSKCWEVLILRVLFKIPTVREKVVVFRVVVFSKDFCICQVLLPVYATFQPCKARLTRLLKLEVGESSFTKGLGCDLWSSCSFWSEGMSFMKCCVRSQLSLCFCWDRSDRKTYLLLAISVCLVPLNFKCTYIKAQMFLMCCYAAAKE